MNAYILSDGEYATDQLKKLDALVKRFLETKGFAVTRRQLEPMELDYCRGCFGCWIKTPGECVIRDAMADINRGTMQSDVAVYLTPVVFGQYSANMKNALDRWIPNILPFFQARRNGDTIHPSRYAENPQFIMIGYGERLSADDKDLFAKITTRHRENGTVLFYEDDDAKLTQALGALTLHKAGALI
ncbi:MAG: flavodoxin family protein [Firmicutes bacterium]|nr:flavodoxin family protein [Bacillota bacterium]